MSTRRSARLSAAGPPAAVPAAPAPTSRKRKAGTAASAVSAKTARRVVDKEDNSQDDGSMAPPPTTPNKRRRDAAATSAVPPITPTPSNAKLLGQPAASSSPLNGVKTPTNNSKKPKPAAVRRLVDPKGTNAQLLSPETSRVVSHVPSQQPPPSPSPSKAPTRTTENILELANAHLISVDERMRPLVENNHCRVFSPEGLAETIDPFESLCSGIISQQVSGAAAKAIKQRFVALFAPSPPVAASEPSGDVPAATDAQFTPPQPRFPQPSQVAACGIPELRSAGLSQRKAEYLQGLAEKFVSGELSAQLLVDVPYEELVERLIAVRGLGRWSIEMFACFALKRLDVFSLGDLGVQRGMAAFVGRDVAKLKSGGKGGKWKYMNEKDMTELAEKFAPYRSLFMWYMWRVEETDVSTME